ncbi:MAG TPA: ABC transporter ATP-binding protein [Streptosporangiaceae bacterium]|nr:ABC transporter ATP-binding protein [Streptosporangiaceae bacterium]
MLEVDVEVDRPEFTVRANFSVAPGERLALFGPSGAGKTTLLEVIAGLVKPRRAVISLAGKPLTSTTSPAITLPPWRRGVGLLRQDPGLFPHLSVRDNLRYGRTAAGDGDEFRRLASTLGIDGLLGKMPARLSGGQAHRVALGRLLLSRCDTLLLDEPYTGLDASLRRTLTELVITLVTERNVPAILVAHELAEAQAFADQLAVLDRGAVLQAGDPGEVVQRPASCRVAELVGYTAFVPADDGTVAGIHPDRIVGGSHPALGQVLEGEVTASRPAGVMWELEVRVGAETVTARMPGPASIGQPLVITATDPPIFWPGGAAIDKAAIDAAAIDTGPPLELRSLESPPFEVGE